MHEVYAALAIAALSHERGQKARPSEEEFYAQYSEVPWGRIRRLVGAMRENLARGREKQVNCDTKPVRSCRLAET